MSRYQKGKTNLDFTGARDSEWQWNSLGQMQVCTSLQTDNYTSTSSLSFLHAGCPSCHPTNSVKALKAQKKEKKRHTQKKIGSFFSASRCTRQQEIVVVCSVCECLTCSRLSGLMSAFERTLKQHLVSYRIKRTSTDTHRVNTLPVWTLMSSAVQSTDPVTIRLSLL